jgi:plastocyanin
MRRLLIAFALVVLPMPALAGDLVVDLKTITGQPVANAVISFKPASGDTAALPARFNAPLTVEQDNIHFNPFILIVPVGAEVSFPNRDKVRHHVYSFSPAKRFELKLYGRDETRKVTFDKAGVVALGCNIHDQMIGFIVVLDTPYAAKVDALGQATLANLPAGGGVLTVWQPFLRGPGNQAVQQIVIPPQGAAHAALALNLRDPPSGKAPLL